MSEKRTTMVSSFQFTTNANKHVGEIIKCNHKLQLHQKKSEALMTQDHKTNIIQHTSSENVDIMEANKCRYENVNFGYAVLSKSFLYQLL